MTSKAAVDPWLRIFEDEEFVGVGFLITLRYAITATHVLGKRELGHRFAARSGRSATLDVSILATSGDLTLLVVEGPLDHGLLPPQAGRAVEKSKWSGPARPELNNAVLTGTIDAVDLDFELESGDLVSVHQLCVDQDLGSHHGYSGGPVVTRRAPPHQVVGVILEQLPDAVEETRSANVLFAIAIDQAFGAFAELTHLAGTRHGLDSDSRADGKVAHDIVLDKHEAVLRRAKRWADEGLIEAVDYEVYKARVQRQIFELLDGGEQR